MGALPVNGIFGVVLVVTFLTVMLTTTRPPVSLPTIVKVVLFAASCNILAVITTDFPFTVTDVPNSDSDNGAGTVLPVPPYCCPGAI